MGCPAEIRLAEVRWAHNCLACLGDLSDESWCANPAQKRIHHDERKNHYDLRHSREMTLLCSPKVSQHHHRAGARFRLDTKGPCPCANTGASSVLRVWLIALFTIQGYLRPINAPQAPPAQGPCPDDGESNRTLRVDDIADHLRSPRRILFFVWVTLNEQKWATFDERRGL